MVGVAWASVNGGYLGAGQWVWPGHQCMVLYLWGWGGGCGMGISVCCCIFRGEAVGVAWAACASVTCVSLVLLVRCVCGSEPGVDADLTDTDVPVVQLPPSSYQPYDPEAEDDDPYGSYYQPNYPPPRPVQPDDPVIEEELRSPGMQRHRR